jgi:hypothetical protein
MKEQLNKVQEHYHGSTTGPVMSFLTATQAPSQVDLDLALKQWHYCSRLARHMYDVCIMFICDIIYVYADKLDSRLTCRFILIFDSFGTISESTLFGNVWVLKLDQLGYKKMSWQLQNL